MCVIMVFSFGILASPLARFLKPTMKPGEFFQAADMPAAVRNVEFNLTDFPADWTCRPFEFQMKYVVFNPEQEQIRKIPGFAVRIAPGNIVAFSRLCPNGRGCILNYKSESCCGCIESTVEQCICAAKRNHAILVCPSHQSTFDLTQGGRVLAGPAPRPPLQFDVIRQGDVISINRLEVGIS